MKYRVRVNENFSASVMIENEVYSTINNSSEGEMYKNLIESVKVEYPIAKYDQLVTGIIHIPNKYLKANYDYRRSPFYIKACEEEERKKLSGKSR